MWNKVLDTKWCMLCGKKGLSRHSLSQKSIRGFTVLEAPRGSEHGLVKAIFKCIAYVFSDLLTFHLLPLWGKKFHLNTDRNTKVQQACCMKFTKHIAAPQRMIPFHFGWHWTFLSFSHYWKGCKKAKALIYCTFHTVPEIYWRYLIMSNNKGLKRVWFCFNQT